MDPQRFLERGVCWSIYAAACCPIAWSQVVTLFSNGIIGSGLSGTILQFTLQGQVECVLRRTVGIWTQACRYAASLAERMMSN